MSVGILLISHNNIGQVMLDTALTNLGRKDLHASAMAIPFDCDPDKRAMDCKEMLQGLDEGQGVLVLTDLYGATPSNIAHKLCQDTRVKVVATQLNPELFWGEGENEEEATEVLRQKIKGLLIPDEILDK